MDFLINCGRKSSGIGDFYFGKAMNVLGALYQKL